MRQRGTGLQIEGTGYLVRMDSVHFVGTATTLIRLGGFTVLTDPNFLHRGQRAYLGKGLWSRRLSEPALTPAQLPRLDAVVLSHLHGDHFDRVARRELTKTPPLITTPSAARKLRRSGFLTFGLDTWHRHILPRDEETLVVEALPGVHARGPLRALLPPVMGSLLTHERDGVTTRVYISGDTLTGDHLREIHDRHPDIDVGIVHLGGTRVLWQTVTMDGPMGAEWVRTVRPGVVIPVHYDDYGVFRSPLSDFVAELDRVGTPTRLLLPSRGETVPLTVPSS
jgi:L-ascorbate metabolism protein UlaG (beta-lactamase superfamily)